MEEKQNTKKTRIKTPQHPKTKPVTPTPIVNKESTVPYKTTLNRILTVSEPKCFKYPNLKPCRVPATQLIVTVKELSRFYLKKGEPKIVPRTNGNGNAQRTINKPTASYEKQTATPDRNIFWPCNIIYCYLLKNV